MFVWCVTLPRVTSLPLLCDVTILACDVISCQAGATTAAERCRPLCRREAQCRATLQVGGHWQERRVYSVLDLVCRLHRNRGPQENAVCCGHARRLLSANARANSVASSLRPLSQE